MKAVITLSAGYVGSELLGGALIVATCPLLSASSQRKSLGSPPYLFLQLCGFDITASKVASFFIGLGLLAPLSMVDHWIPILSILCSVSFFSSFVLPCLSLISLPLQL